MDYSVEEEYEANEFAHNILHSSWTLKLRRFIKELKKIIITVCIIALAACIVLAGVSHIVHRQSYYGEYYITENGHKYHEKDCIFVKDKSNVHRLTEEEYNSEEYEPCKMCLPSN